MISLVLNDNNNKITKSAPANTVESNLLQGKPENDMNKTKPRECSYFFVFYDFNVFSSFL
jgi:hypothetical protein